MDRRAFLTGAAGVAALTPATASAKAELPATTGSIDAGLQGLVPGAPDDQSRVFQALVNEAARGDRPLFVPPGRYVVSNIILPPRSRIVGVPGASRLVFGGDGHLLMAENAEVVALAGLVLDGADLPLGEYVSGLVQIAQSIGVAIDDCTVTASSKCGIALERAAGRITRSTIAGAREAGIRAIESTGLSITDNAIAGSGNAGILVWRWTEGDDGTLVSGNRISGIAAEGGGAGENGNGIHVFRAHGVIVSGNQIRDCAFTAIRANSASNIQITGNTCSSLGEVGIFSEFGFNGALVANNIVDRAATGIRVANFDTGGRIAVVANNIVRDLTGSGPYPADPPGFGVGIAVEADVSLSGNVIDGAPLYGIMLGWGPFLRDIAATGNVVRRAPVGVAVSVVEGAGAVVIADNLISGADRGAIVGMRWSDRASGDLARTGADAFPHLMVERNRVG